MEDELIITPMPSLVATLLNMENKKGSELTREEVMEITDKIPCVVLTPENRKKIDERRGYDDIDPEWAWEQWREVRTELI